MSTNAVAYPSMLEIRPLPNPTKAIIRVPGSKSLTNRALILAALSEPGVGAFITGILQSEDTELMLQCLRDLGFEVSIDWNEKAVHIKRRVSDPIIPLKEANLFVGNSGTTMRFVTALVSFGQGRYRLDGVSRMRERPIKDLLAGLQQLGGNIVCENKEGFPPVVVNAHGLEGGRVAIKGDVSSQFLSGLLMAAPLARGPVTIQICGDLVSRPYVAMTAALMRQFGGLVEETSEGFEVCPIAHYQAKTLAIEPDASAASYFWGAAAITESEIEVDGLGPFSLQGDVEFTRILEKMGCSVAPNRANVIVKGRPLRGIDVDMNAISDTVMTLAAVACFAQGPTTIRNVAHIRHKETDRLAALATELRRVGAGVEELADGLTIHPHPLHGAPIETYNDHRMAMSMALIGLKIPGIVIKNPACVAKTYPRFFDDLEKMR